ncbi:hypothetical protein LTR37_007552 [Vermiconidia calcicola]|uniref:Uncharacterized protein n=1 Tax=Vermiconidia calcicola TaxID=1690605 RepID=A0ACC3ND40_9PEZI|nr:hypothetical protein LTR37_007552 [Vermiconidia calcicola]
MEEPQLSRIGQLPGELRYLIFRYVVLIGDPITIPTKLISTGEDLFDDGDLLDKAEIALPITQPAVALVNRAFRSEALPIFYGENAFVLDKGVDLAEVIPSLRDWIDLLKRYTRTAAEVGARGEHHGTVYLLASVDEKGTLVHSWKGLTDDTYACPSRLNELSEVLERDQLEVGEVLKRVLKACQADMGQMIAKSEQAAHSDSDEGLCTLFD